MQDMEVDRGQERNRCASEPIHFNEDEIEVQHRPAQSPTHSHQVRFHSQEYRNDASTSKFILPPKATFERLEEQAVVSMLVSEPSSSRDVVMERDQQVREEIIDAEDIARQHSIADPEKSSKEMALLLANQPPTPPPRRALRERKAAQLAPYTTEMERYKRRLIRNDWQDAVVVTREIARALKAKSLEKDSVNNENQSGDTRISENVNATHTDGTKQSKSKVNKNTDDVRVLIEINANKAQEKRKNTRPKPRPTRQRSNSPSKVVSQNEQIVMNRKRSRILPDSDEESVEMGMIGHSEHQAEQDDVFVDGSKDVIEGVIRNSEDETDEDDDEEDFIVDHVNTNKQTSNRMSGRDYKRLLKMLRRTMPARMARAHIDDLMAMDKEMQNLHSNVERNDHQRTPEPTVMIEEEEEGEEQDLLPGQSKKRQRTDINSREDRFQLLGDSEEDDDDNDSMSDASSSSSSSVTSSSRPTARLFSPASDLNLSISDYEPDNLIEINIDKDRYKEPHHKVNGNKEAAKRKKLRTQSRQGARDFDDIDRMLFRGPRNRNSTKSVRRQARAIPRTMKAQSSIRTIGSRGQTSIRRNGNNEQTRTRKVKSRTGVRSKFSTSHNHNRHRGTYARQDHQRLRPIVNDEDFFLSVDTEFEMQIERNVTVSKTDTSKGSVTSMKPVRPKSRETSVSSPLSAGLRRSTNDIISRSNNHSSPFDTNSGRLQPYSPLSPSVSTPLSAITPPPPLHSRTILPNSASNLPANLEQQRLEAEAWSSVGPIRLCFDLTRPNLGLRCDSQGYIGRGRLYMLLHETETQRRATYEELLESAIDQNDAESIWKDLWADMTMEGEVERYSDSRSKEENLNRIQSHIDRVMESLIRSYPMGNVDDSHLFNTIEIIDNLISFARKGVEVRNFRELQSVILSKLQWCKLEMVWRFCKRKNESSNLFILGNDLDIDKEFFQTCQELMVTLLVHGLHRTIASIKSADRREADEYETEDAALRSIKDWSLEYWICLMYLLESDTVKSMNLSHTSSPFWNVFEKSLHIYQSALKMSKSTFIVAENTWYSTFSIMCISHFSSTTGSCMTQSVLKSPCWTVIAHALSVVKIRFDDRVEASMSLGSLHARDHYIYIVLQRILLLADEWKWKMDNVEQLLPKLFNIFNASRLQDLPSEKDHDFPTFLESLDVNFLHSEEGDDRNSFHVYLRILALAVQNAKTTANSNQELAEKIASRLLSRFSPMRSVQITPERMPTSLERSALINHYSIALLYLFFVPSSEQQRFLQLQQYLNIGKADSKSQLIGIRAMMYAAIILRHHNLSIERAMSWFKSVFVHMMRNFQYLQSNLNVSRLDYGSIKRRTWESQTTLMMACLRAVQYILERNNLDPLNESIHLPDISLVDPSWTSDLIMDSSLLFQCPSLTIESLQLMSSFFEKIKKINHPEKKKTNQGYDLSSSSLNESQDSCAELFEDVDFDDIALLDIAGYGNDKNSEVIQKSDSSLVKMNKQAEEQRIRAFLHEILSPALFKLIINIAQPENASSFGFETINVSDDNRFDHSNLRKQLENGTFSVENHVGALVDRSKKASIGKMAIECWAKCALILVEDYKIRSWDYYFRHGREDVRMSLLHDEIRQEVLMKFFLIVLQESSQSKISSPNIIPLLKTSEEDVYCANLTEIWGCLLINLMTIPAKSTLGKFIETIKQFETTRISRLPIEKRYGIFDEANQLDKIDIQNEEERIELILDFISGLCEVSKQSHFLGNVIGTISTLFSFIRQSTIQITSNLKGSNEAFSLHLYQSKKVLKHCHNRFDQHLSRGLAIDLRKTENLVQQHLDERQ